VLHIYIYIYDISCLRVKINSVLPPLKIKIIIFILSADEIFSHTDVARHFS